MSNKYTIFDNFDKLDLSPAASLFRQDSLTEASQIVAGNNFLTYRTLNETGIVDISKNSRPIAYSSANMETGVVPDMFRYITNNRFYISVGAKGEIYHTSKLKFLEEIFISVKDSLLADNAFYDRFFFNIFLQQFTSIFADAVRLYNNPFYTPEVKNNYNSSIRNYFKHNDEGLLDDDFLALTQFNPKSTSLGNNIPLFVNQNENFPLPPEQLLLEDLFSSQNYNSVLDYLKSQDLEVYNQAILFLQRLFYPVQTAIGATPKHHYFVSDLEKSNSVLITPVYNRDPLARKSDVLLEWQLPNIYAYYSYLNSQEGADISKYYLDVVKLDHEGDLNLDNFSIEKYYDISKKSQAYTDLADSPNDEDYGKYAKLLRHRNTVFGGDFFKKSADLATVKDIFPVYNEIKLPSRDSELMGAFQSSNKVDFFMNLIANYFKSSVGGVHTFCLHNKEDETASLSLTDLQVVDINEASKEDFYFWGYSYIPNNKFTFSYFDLLNNLDDPENIENVKSDTGDLLHIIKGYSETKRKTYNDIHNGEKCHSEILAYEVVKYGLIDGEKTELQSFFVPNLQGNAQTLIDTQVFYDKDYIYEVFSISLVVGAEYNSELNVKNVGLFGKTIYKNTEMLGVGYQDQGLEIVPYSVNFLPVPQETEFTPGDLLSRAKSIIVRAPYFNTLSTTGGGEQKKTTILDKPPLPPDISFYPYKDIDNKILITLGVNYGKKRMYPIEVFPGDGEQIQKHYDNQKDLSAETPFDGAIDSYLSAIKKLDILYETDDFLGTYRVWRTTQKPINWGAFYSSVPVEIENQSSTAFEDKILPNVDYYYFARFEDPNGNFSNPTDIFYLRMVREGGFPPYLIVKKYDFSEGRPPVVYEKSFKKYLKIRLADGTREFYNTDDPNKIDFGYKKANSSSQLKKYKIRITSKKTGKKIDINVDFNKDISNQYLTDISKTATSSNPTVPTNAQEEFKNIENQIKKKVIGDAPGIPSLPLMDSLE